MAQPQPQPQPQAYMDPNLYLQQQNANYLRYAQENAMPVANSFYYDPYTANYNYYATAAAYGAYPQTAAAAAAAPGGYPQTMVGYPQAAAGYGMDPNQLAMYNQMQSQAAVAAAYAQQQGAYGYAQPHMGQPMMAQQGGGVMPDGVAVGGQGQGQGPRK